MELRVVSILIFIKVSIAAIASPVALASAALPSRVNVVSTGIVVSGVKYNALGFNEFAANSRSYCAYVNLCICKVDKFSVIKKNTSF